VSKTVTIGPDLPAGLESLRIDTDKPTSAPTVVSESPLPENVLEVRENGTYVVRTTDVNGNFVDTIMGVAKVQHETKEQVKARVKESYTDVNGNLVETY
jgi:hypothetical protein